MKYALTLTAHYVLYPFFQGATINFGLPLQTISFPLSQISKTWLLFFPFSCLPCMRGYVLFKPIWVSRALLIRSECFLKVFSSLAFGCYSHSKPYQYVWSYCRLTTNTWRVSIVFLIFYSTFFRSLPLCRSAASKVSLSVSLASSIFTIYRSLSITRYTFKYIRIVSSFCVKQTIVENWLSVCLPLTLTLFRSNLIYGHEVLWAYGSLRGASYKREMGFHILFLNIVGVGYEMKGLR